MGHSIKWSRARLARLKELIDERMTCPQVASAMGLTVGRVEREAYRQGWRFNGAKVSPKSAPKSEPPVDAWVWLICKMPVAGGAR